MNRIPRLLPLAGSALSLLLGACTGEQAPGVIGPRDASADSGQGNSDAGGEGDGQARDASGGSDAPRDGATRVDAIGTDSGTAREFGEACDNDLQCGGQPCFKITVEQPTGTCSRYCANQDECPDGNSCILFVTSGGDAVRVCVDNNLCIDADGDGYGIGPGCSGPDCDDDDDAVFFGADEICDGRDNDCDGNIDENPVGANVDCDTGRLGICAAGRQFCFNGDLECVPTRTAGEEFCDGIDNDCDGDIDEGANGQSISEACYNAPAATLGIGQCTGGTRTCSAGQYSDCIGQVLPFPEICDGLDNDCDGEVDEGNPGGGIRCSAGTGSCAGGVTACVEGNLTCIPATEGTPEICDGQDNDCDGDVDEDFDGLGDLCTSGLGLCRRVGVVSCQTDPTAAPVCNAEIIAPAGQETCDYADDDCDGDVDEGFRNDAGIYDGVRNCGGCALDCTNFWPGGEALYNVQATCNVDGGFARCGFTCLPGWIDADGVQENGCELNPDPNAVYVAAATGTDGNNCGALDAPCASIARGIARAAALGRERVRVSDGLYRENVTLQNGISVLGGHNARNWVQNPEIFVSVITGTTTSPTGPDRVAVSARNIDRATTFSGFTINGEPAAPGGNSIGIHIVDANERLIVERNVVFAGPGGQGVTGGRGNRGDSGTVGSNGTNAALRSNCNGSNLPGGGGGQKTCNNPNGNGTTVVSGGAGGTSICPVFGAFNGAGAAGSGPTPGAGGPAGASLQGSSSVFGGRTCSVQTSGGSSLPIDPSPGNPGSPGNDGRGGNAPTTAEGSVDASGFWRGDAGARGVHGQHGSGGGGGGAAAGVDASSEKYYGASGSGGGSGGCAGAAGLGGNGGGGSFAVFIAFSGAGPSSAGQFPIVRSNRLARGLGGSGGPGGIGGAGGDGGLGGIRGFANPQSGWNYGFCLVDGGTGAPGGRGGHGGGGAGGAGGASWDLWVHNANGHDPGYATANDFSIPANVDTAGVGGPGGNSSNTTNGFGQDGPPGIFGRIRFVP